MLCSCSSSRSQRRRSFPWDGSCEHALASCTYGFVSRVCGFDLSDTCQGCDAQRDHRNSHSVNVQCNAVQSFCSEAMPMLRFCVSLVTLDRLNVVRTTGRPACAETISEQPENGAKHSTNESRTECECQHRCIYCQSDEGECSTPTQQPAEQKSQRRSCIWSEIPAQNRKWP